MPTELQAIEKLLSTLQNLQNVSLPVLGAILGVFGIAMIIIIVRALGRVNTQYVPLMTQMVAQSVVQNTTLTAQTEVLTKATQADHALLNQMNVTVAESVQFFRQSHESLRHSITEVAKINATLSQTVEHVAELVRQNTQTLNAREVLEERLNLQEKLVAGLGAENNQLKLEVDRLKIQVDGEVAARERVERERDGLIDQNRTMSRKIEELQRKVKALEDKLNTPATEKVEVEE